MLNLTSAIMIIRLRGFSSKGRASRAEFWWAFLIMLFLGIWLGIMEHQVIPGTILEKVYLYTSIFLGLMCFCYQLIIGVRRFHDLNLSGYWALIHFVPVIGNLIFLGFMVKTGKKDFNRFGPSPLYPEFYEALNEGKLEVLDKTTEAELVSLVDTLRKEQTTTKS